jgi:translation elongation factor EF-Tu-like GTPase
MIIMIAGHVGTGHETLAGKLSDRMSNHTFISLSYENPGDTRKELATADIVILAVNLLDGPMPGTRAALEDCRRLGKRLGGFILTRVDEFDAQSMYGPHVKELVGIEARELASVYGYADDDLPSASVPVDGGDQEKLAALIDTITSK